MRTITSRACAAAASAVLVGATAFAGATAEAAEHAAPRPNASMRAALAMFPEYRAVPDSRGSKAPVILRGRITGKGGKPLSGAAILLGAWPKNSEVSNLPAGGTLDIMPVGRTVSGKDGTFVLRVKRTAAVNKRVENGYLDVSFEIVHAKRSYTNLGQAETGSSVKGWAPKRVDLEALGGQPIPAGR
jgi:hypothetical protein